MFISVEISSYNRWYVLKQVLERLEDQSYPADQFEVVVSDDGSDDSTIALISEYAAQAPYTLTLVVNVHAGCGATHNSGILRARGDIVLMIADDILPTRRLLEEHARMHDIHPDPAVGIVGRLEQSPALAQTVFQKSWNRLLNARFPRNRTELDYREFWVNNLSFKKDFMLRHGMFRVWPPASHEDVELGYRLQTQGMRLIFCDAALAFHHHPETIDSLACRSYLQGYNWSLFEAHVPERWVRARSGNFVWGDGIAARLRFSVRLVVRSVLFNRLTVSRLWMPLIRRAETCAWLTPFVPPSVGKVAAYYFRKGIVDSRRGTPYRFS